ncbi:hypothetical protein LguiB_024353 [Lonicera macranthoides]
MEVLRTQPTQTSLSKPLEGRILQDPHEEPLPVRGATTSEHLQLSKLLLYPVPRGVTKVMGTIIPAGRYPDLFCLRMSHHYQKHQKACLEQKVLPNQPLGR